MNNENNDNSVTAPSWRIFKIGLQWQALTINYCRNGSCSGEPYRDPTTVKLLPKSTTCRVETLHPLRGRNGWRPPRFVQVTGWVDDPGGSLASIFLRGSPFCEPRSNVSVEDGLPQLEAVQWRVQQVYGGIVAGWSCLPGAVLKFIRCLLYNLHQGAVP